MFVTDTWYPFLGLFQIVVSLFHCFMFQKVIFVILVNLFWVYYKGGTFGDTSAALLPE